MSNEKNTPFDNRDCQEKSSPYSEIEKRLNLQSLGDFLRWGADRCLLDHACYQTREDAADRRIKEYVASHLGEESTGKLMDAIYEYAYDLEDIHFSLGMKTGAKLALLLTDGFESDF